MRQPRLKARPLADGAYYHCISRVVDRQFLFQEQEKEQFVSFLWEYARFCDVQVVAYCVMSNHFHLLIRVPKRPATLPDDNQLLAKLEQLSGLTGAATLRQRLETFRAQGHNQAAEELRERLLARMWDVSVFMKLVKQRFASWYNRQHGRKGTLWEERFKSVLVESAGPALATMAAYIDLNPVRANLVESPEQYRWCSYAAAVAGDKRMRAGYGLIFGETVEKRKVLSTYRLWLYGQGEENEGTTESGAPVRKGISREKVVEVIAAKGQVSLGDYLRCRVRYFADGLVFGSQNFVEGVFTGMRERFGPKRKDGARRMAGVDQPLYSMRNLRVKAVT